MLIVCETSAVKLHAQAAEKLIKIQILAIIITVILIIFMNLSVLKQLKRVEK